MSEGNVIVLDRCVLFLRVSTVVLSLCFLYRKMKSVLHQSLVSLRLPAMLHSCLATGSSCPMNILKSYVSTPRLGQTINVNTTKL